MAISGHLRRTSGSCGCGVFVPGKMLGFDVNHVCGHLMTMVGRAGVHILLVALAGGVSAARSEVVEVRFGAPEHAKTRHLVSGVVAGIGGYGNSFGVPTVGGSVNFHTRYDGNILVNAMAVGLARAMELVEDFEEVTGSSDLNIPPHIGDYMQRSEKLAELAYFFAKPEGRKEFDRIASMPANSPAPRRRRRARCGSPPAIPAR